MKKHDIVKHKLDGRAMIVLRFSQCKNFILCQYWTGDKYREDWFEKELLN